MALAEASSPYKIFKNVSLVLVQSTAQKITLTEADLTIRPFQPENDTAVDFYPDLTSNLDVNTTS
jgi:hypothetical protein